MADRTRAEIWAHAFRACANDADYRSFAPNYWQRLWEDKDNGEADFDFYQMYCDPALVKLGFAKRGGGKKRSEVMYAGADGKFPDARKEASWWSGFFDD